MSRAIVPNIANMYVSNKKGPRDLGEFLDVLLKIAVVVFIIIVRTDQSKFTAPTLIKN